MYDLQIDILQLQSEEFVINQKNKLPVFIFCGKSPIGASGGGYSAYAYNLAKILQKIGHETMIVALGNENKIINTNVGNLMLVKSSFLNVNITALPGLPLFSFAFANEVNLFAKKKGYAKYIAWGIGPWGFAATLLKLLFNKNVIHINNYFTTTKHEWAGALNAVRTQDYGILLKIKYLIIFNTVVKYLTWLEGILLKRTDIIITNYKSTEEIIKKQFGLDSSRFKRTNFTVEIYARKSAKETKNNLKLPKKYLLFFSRHDPRKGINFLLHSMKILEKKGYKVPLLIGGTGDMYEANKYLAKKLKLKYVKFLGFVDNTKPLLKNASAFVFPTIEEGAGALTINEAMSIGAPIVSSSCDGIIEDINNGKSGILVEPGNPQALALGIIKLLDSPVLAKKLGANAKISYKKRFNFNLMYKDIDKLLNTVTRE